MTLEDAGDRKQREDEQIRQRSMLFEVVAETLRAVDIVNAALAVGRPTPLDVLHGHLITAQEVLVAAWSERDCRQKPCREAT